jgi:restriction system protein
MINGDSLKFDFLISVKTTFNRSSTTCRPDDVLLRTSLDKINGAEFERLLSLYFKDQGYTVKEVGVGGKDGGVDLVIVDKRGEKTAVQAKCYAGHYVRSYSGCEAGGGAIQG